MEAAMASRYDEVYRRSLADPEGFWAEAANDIVWYRKWDTVLDRSNPPFYRWFVGGETNTCMNAMDRHVDEGNGDRLALIYDSPVTGSQRRPEEHTSELQSLIRITYAVFCLKKKIEKQKTDTTQQ